MTLEVIIGPMFSGKTSELIRLVEREVYAKKKGAIFKIAFDKRYSAKQVVTHNGLKYDAYTVASSAEGLRKIEELAVSQGLDAIGVDEVNFFPDALVGVLDRLADTRRVIACGLNLNFRAEPFPTTMQLAARADREVPERGVRRVRPRGDEDPEADCREASAEGLPNYRRRGKRDV